MQRAPNAAAFPKKTLIFSVDIPVAILCVLPLGDALGHEWNIHGDMILVFFSFAIASALAFLVLFVALQIAIKCLIHHPALRTKWDVSLTAVATLFEVGCVVLFIAMATASHH